MFGNKKVDTQKAMQNIARQKLMRGQATDANMIQNFGSLGAGAASQALSNTLRHQNTQQNPTNPNGNSAQAASDANKRKAAGIMNTVNQSKDHSDIGSSILGAIGK